MGLQIAVKDPVRVAASDAGDDLAQERPHDGQRQTDPLGNVVRALLRIHERLQIVADVLEDQVQTARLGLDDVQQFDLWRY